MTHLTQDGLQIVSTQAARHGVSEDTILTLLAALQRGGSSQAQFNIPELGGMGQWQQGGMTMVGDMFNNGLKARVDALCRDLATALRSTEIFVPDVSTNLSEWPAELGHPSAQGAQSDIGYALFPATNRLAVKQGGQITMYDTTGHAVTGFGQSQSGTQSLSFTSQNGTQAVSTLPIITGP